MNPTLGTMKTILLIAFLLTGLSALAQDTVRVTAQREQLERSILKTTGDDLVFIKGKWMRLKSKLYTNSKLELAITINHHFSVKDGEYWIYFYDPKTNVFQLLDMGATVTI